MSAVAETRPAPAPSGELTHRQILTILAGLMLGMFLAALDQTVVATAIRTIADDLGGLSQQAWATTAFLITSTITTPLYGKLSDIYGRKPLFLFAISIFIVGSITCTFAQSMYQLAAFRALQGIGAGGLFSLALTILGDIVPPRERARYQGLFLAVFGTSSVLGPVIGGLLAGAPEILGIAGWRWIFLVNVPIGVLALVVVAKVLNVPHIRRRHRIDWPGAVALIIGLVPLLIVAEQGREWGWDSGRSIACYLVGVVGLVLFVLIERWYGDEALLPLRLFRISVFALVTGVAVLIGMAMFGGIALLPQFLQIVKGATPVESGFLMLPLVAGIMLASVASGQLTSRTGRYKIFPVIGTLVMTAAMVIMHFRLNVDIPLWELDLYMAMFGLGLGCCMQTLILAVQNASPARDMGVVTASSTFFRQLGGTLGTAIFLSIVFSTLLGNIKDAFTSASTSDPSFQAALSDPAVRANPANAPFFAQLQGGDSSSVLNDSAFLQHIDTRLARPILIGFSESISLTFIVVAAVTAIAFILVLFVKEVPLRTMSGAQAAAMEAAEAAGHAPAPVPAEVANVPSEPARRQQPPEPAGRHSLATFEPGKEARPNGRGNGHGTLPGDLLPEGPALVGAVRRGDGPGLGDVVVTVADPAGRHAARTTTEPDGSYRVPLRSGGTYLVVAAARSFRPHARLVSVADGAARHDIALAGPCGVEGAVRTPEGAGPAQTVPGAAVALIDGDGDVAASCVTDAAGRFVLAGVPEGDYTITAATPGFHPVATSLRLADGATVEHDLHLPPRSRLVGTVTAASSGLPVDEAVATLLDETGTVVGSAVTGPDGTFVFEDLPEGTYTLTAVGYAPVAQTVTLNAGVPAAATVELRPASADGARPSAVNLTKAP